MCYVRRASDGSYSLKKELNSLARRENNPLERRGHTKDLDAASHRAVVTKSKVVICVYIGAAIELDIGIQKRTTEILRVSPWNHQSPYSVH